MPDLLTHIIFGNRMYKDIKNHKMFNLGLMGPDPFFYVVKDKNYKNAGDKLHNVKYMDFLKELNKISPDYAMGYFLHMFLDEQFHPKIFEVAGSGRKHKKFEVLMDAVYVRKYLNKSFKKLDILSLFPNKLDVDFIVTYDELLMDFYEINSSFKVAHENFIKVIKLLYNHYSLKSIIVYLLALVTFGKINYTNIYYFKEPNESILNKCGFDKLWEKAEKEFIKINERGIF
ncbi:hypothetical protein OSSY52_06810 [Tepiditoga spiralis]|uniref:Phospholipase C/D domain-containing protein n=1 Tax=Tepiditoga spiralis TaxID=2108365 RepID=A0A7G1G2G4_9BACT|nr:hypothetical protein [Tepiditoga spiralis]BBE30540.1 hypothetical protein OSSY52_06810 [Tepiditoga spiralis]